MYFKLVSSFSCLFTPRLSFFSWYFSPLRTERSKVMDEKEAADEPSWKEQREYAATEEEKKVSIFFPFYTKVNVFWRFHTAQYCHKGIFKNVTWFLQFSRLKYKSHLSGLCLKCYRCMRSNSKTLTHLNFLSVYLLVWFSLVFCFWSWRVDCNSCHWCTTLFFKSSGQSVITSPRSWTDPHK